MDQAGIVAIWFVPAALFWAILTIEGRPASRLNTQSLAIVRWLLGYANQMLSAAALVILVISSVLSAVAFFSYDELKSRGWVHWYFATLLSMVAVQAVMLLLLHLLLRRGRRENLIE
jgi:hypothetical protein